MAVSLAVCGTALVSVTQHTPGVRSGPIKIEITMQSTENVALRELQALRCTVMSILAYCSISSPFGIGPQATFERGTTSITRKSVGLLSPGLSLSGI